MARRELPPAALVVAAAVAAALPDGDVVVGCSGGADSLALALGASWAARRAGTRAEVLVIDHGLQSGSADVADGVVARLAAAGVPARAQRVEVRPGADGVEAAARDDRLAALAEPGLPVLLGHTLDDQAETVLLGLLRGSGARSLAGMAAVRGPFHRPLLGLRRSDTEAACRAWGVDWWADPMNDDPAFARVRARRALADALRGARPRRRPRARPHRAARPRRRGPARRACRRRGPPHARWGAPRRRPERPPRRPPLAGPALLARGGSHVRARARRRRAGHGVARPGPHRGAGRRCAARGRAASVDPLGSPRGCS